MNIKKLIHLVTGFTVRQNTTSRILLQYLRHKARHQKYRKHVRVHRLLSVWAAYKWFGAMSMHVLNYKDEHVYLVCDN